MDRLQSILLGAGFGCFVLAFLLSGLYPYLITDHRVPEASIAVVAAQVTPDFMALKEEWPVQFLEAFPEGRDGLLPRELASLPGDHPARQRSEAAWQAAHATALRRGRDIYVAEACWHCHSQYVRPVANEETRFGPVRSTDDDNNALQRPVLWGTRRVGPDLTHAGGQRSNDWHFAHLRDPSSTTPGSVMPAYTWYFRGGFEVHRTIDPETAEREELPPDRTYAYPGLHPTREAAEAALRHIAETLHPNLAAEGERLVVREGSGPTGDGLALVAYLQWLGTWSAPSSGEASQ
jgi:cytochrome c oxidase cbb3-type subunit 2